MYGNVTFALFYPEVLGTGLKIPKHGTTNRMLSSVLCPTVDQTETGTLFSLQFSGGYIQVNDVSSVICRLHKTRDAGCIDAGCIVPTSFDSQGQSLSPPRIAPGLRHPFCDGPVCSSPQQCYLFPRLPRYPPEKTARQCGRSQRGTKSATCCNISGPSRRIVVTNLLCGVCSSIEAAESMERGRLGQRTDLAC